MDWASIAQYCELALGLLLIVRLLSLNLQGVYRYFCIFLLADISGTLIWSVQQATRYTHHFDYRIGWLIGRLFAWPFTLLTVYALLGAILANLQGILRLSRKFLNWSFGIALGIGMLTILPEYDAASAARPLNGFLAHVIQAALILDRAVTSVALIVLLLILAFLAWFPVQISRNIKMFFTGFVVYFALKCCFMLAASYWAPSPHARHVANLAQAILAASIFAYWVLFISRAGETVSKLLTVVAWPPRERELLVGQLEAMNASLLRTVRR